MEKFNDLSKAAHENAVKHGWWNDNPSVEHCLMLVVTEVSEMVEADRKSDDARLRHIRKQKNLAAAQKIKYTEELERAGDAGFDTAFTEHIKNTVQDEMADVAIRLLDLAGKLGMDFTMLSPMRYHRAFDKFTFTENAFALTKGLCRENINIFKRIQFGLHFVTKWAKNRGIDLDWHIKQKMRFNANRPFKHGKSY